MKEQLRRLAEVDVDPPPSDAALYIMNEMDLEGYKRLLAIGNSWNAPVLPALQPTVRIQMSAINTNQS